MGVWIGWLVAATALAALGLMWQWLRHEIAERNDVERAHDALGAQIQDLRSQHDQVARIDHLAGLGQLLAGAAPQMIKPLSAARARISSVAEQWIDYRNLVAGCDVAVQQCLAPLDMLVGTDAAELDAAQLNRLVLHVAASRKRVFDAQAALAASTLAGDAPVLLRDTVEQLDHAIGLFEGIGGGRPPGDMTESFDLVGAADAAIALAQPKLGDRIRVVRRIGDLPPIRGSIADIRQVLLHLVNNACEAIGGEGVLTLEIRTVGSDIVEIDVADTGCGINDEILPRVFEPFFSTRPQQHVGLGLAVVHRVVKAHNGAVQLRTQPGAGTRVTLRLPVSGRSINNVTPLFRQRESA